MDVNDILKTFLLNQSLYLGFLPAVPVQVQLPVWMTQMDLFPCPYHFRVILLLFKASCADTAPLFQLCKRGGGIHRRIVDLLQMLAIGLPGFLVLLGKNDKTVQGSNGFLVGAELSCLPLDPVGFV